jgi:Asp/Glu/hydantoin racemase
MKLRVIRPASRDGTDPDFMAHSHAVTQSYGAPGTEIETVFLDVGHHGGSMGGHLSEARIMANAPALVREVIAAEQAGCDAVLVSGEYDVGAEFARHCVRIPVVDAGTASLHAGALLGDNIGVIVTQPSVKTYARKLLRRWRMTDFVGATTAWGMPLAEAWERRGEIKELTLRLCHELIDDGDVDVIVPLCAVFVPFIVDPCELEDALGLPVVNGVAVGVKTAEMFAAFKMSQSAKAYPPAAPAAWTKAL